MDHTRFDPVTDALGERRSRRQALTLFAGGALGGLVSVIERSNGRWSGGRRFVSPSIRDRGA